MDGMEKYRRMRKRIPAAFAVLLLIMAARQLFLAWSVRLEYEEGIKSMIGTLYEKEAESAEQKMNWLLEGGRDAA